MSKKSILDLESYGCFNFFWNEVSYSEKGFGLVRDSTLKSGKHSNVSSIASTGFGLSSIIIGIERRYITYDEGYIRVKKTLETIHNLENIRGFYYHFINMDTGKRAWNSEVSVIDTSILIMGIMSVSEYFGGEIKSLFKKIYHRIDWEFFRNEKTNRFYMGYNNEEGSFGEWDSYAEQLIMYFLGVAAPKNNINSNMFYSFNRNIYNFNGEDFIYSPFGSLFTYQFSHGFIDFRNMEDKLGVNFFRNSVIASKNDRSFCIKNSINSKTYNKYAWGITPCCTPDGYEGTLGVKPSIIKNIQEGTIPPCGSIASIVFTPEESIDSMNYFYDNFKSNIWGEYGFKDSYNLDKNWFCDYEIGINKGISIVMIENFRTGLIWNLIMRNEYIKKAIELLEFKVWKYNCN